jgi:acyl-CoA synthetase (AMP-forming)/AMP-acid ligase II
VSAASVPSHWHRQSTHRRLESLFGDRVEPCFADRPKSLHQMLQSAADRHGQRCALVCGDQRLSYRELLAAAAQLAAGMAHCGVQAGDRVALLLGNRIEFVVALFAAARLGAISVPLSIREQTPGLTYMLEHCGAVLLLHEAELAGILPAAASVPALQHRWQIGPGPLAGGSSAYAEHVLAQEAPVAAVHEQDTAAILYTSGTTGRPKGAMLTHLGIVHSSMHFALAMALGSDDATVAAVPLSHVTGLVALTTTFVYCAGKMVIMPAFKATEYLRIAGAERITHSLMVPAMYKLCLIDPTFDQYDLSAWRIGAYGGAPMPVATIVELAGKLPELMLMNCYGATETTSPATVMPPGQTRAHNDTVGQALHCVDMRVMDDEGRELPPGTLGEIWIKGPMVVRGYWNNPEATQTNITGGYWHSGDLGTIDEQGYVRVMDRKKDMINRGGFKIYTIEVENALYEHAAVQECAVVAKPCPVLGERVHAFVGLKPGHLASAALDSELKAHCAARLSDYKVPESFAVSAQPLPRNANGKLLKREMRDQLAATTSMVVEKRS